MGSERPDTEAGWDGFGYQAKISGYHPTGEREPEQGGESWKLNGGEAGAAGPGCFYSAPWRNPKFKEA